MKTLLVSFYFPPAGGGGVQRPLKLAQYLPTMGIETHVLAPDDPRWLHRDESLRMPSQAWVHRARYVGVSGGKPSEVLVGTQGLERALTQARLQLRRLVVPDENATWALTAIPAGIRLVREHGIDVVVSTSPPGSTHLIAAAIARATGIRWVADLRDSLVAHAHRRADTTATKAKAALHGQVARLVAGRADAITCVSEAISAETRALEPRGPVVTIPNGADFDDVAGLVHHPADRFRLTHTGSFFGRRDPRPFLQALADSRLDVVARFLGDFREADRTWAETLALGDRFQLLPYASRADSLALQRDSEALLLLIPEAGGRGQGRSLGQGLRVHRRRAPDPRGGAARRRRRRADPRHGRRRRRGAGGRGGDPVGARRAPPPVACRRLAGRRAHRGLAGPPLAPHARRGDGRRAARYPHLTVESRITGASRGDRRRLAAIGVWLALVLAVIAVRYPDAFRAANDTARANAALDLVDRTLGGGNSVFPDQGLMLEARGRIPPDGTFQVAVGGQQPGWTDLTATYAETYARYFLLPRRAEPGAGWILCLACDRAAFPGADAVWEGEAGLSLLRAEQ